MKECSEFLAAGGKSKKKKDEKNQDQLQLSMLTQASLTSSPRGVEMMVARLLHTLSLPRNLHCF